MELDALARAIVSNLFVPSQSISLQSEAIMACSSGSGSDGGGGYCNRLHRPGSGEFECVKKGEWEELVEELGELLWQLELLE